MSGTAIFDMDKTLTRRGTWSRFMFRANRNRLSFYVRLPVLALHAMIYKMKLCSRKSVKEHGLRTLTWASREHLERIATEFADDEVASGLRQHTKSILEAHRSAGDKLIMATAAADLVAMPIAKKLGFDLIISTELDWTPADRLTGRLKTENCYGQEKLERLLTADQDQRFSRPITGYSDHVTDEPFLSWADQGIAVNPSRGLKRISPQAGFTIQDWDQEDPPQITTRETKPS